MNGRKTAREYFAVATVRTERYIVFIEYESLSYSSCFLPHGKVCGAGIRMFKAVVFALYFYGINHAFEFAKGCDIFKHGNEFAFLEVLLLVGNRFIVLVYRYVFKMNRSAFSYKIRIDELTLRHFI